MSSHVHALNNSPAHQKYTFSKEQRFVYGKAKYLCLHLALMFTTCPSLTRTKGLPSLAVAKGLSSGSMISPP